jgi:hypothetical protein
MCLDGRMQRCVIAFLLIGATLTVGKVKCIICLLSVKALLFPVLQQHPLVVSECGRSLVLLLLLLLLLLPIQGTSFRVFIVPTLLLSWIIIDRREGND